MSGTSYRAIYTFVIAGVLAVGGQRGEALAAIPGFSSDIRTVALSGQPTPGLGPNIAFHSFGKPSLNLSGEAAFIATLTGVNSLRDSSIWRESTSGVQLTVQEFNQAPNPNSFLRFRDLSAPFLLSDGQLAFGGDLSTTQDRSGVWITAPSVVQQINGYGFPVPDANGEPLDDYTWSNFGIAAAYSSKVMLLGGAARHANGITLTGGYWLFKDGQIRFIVRSDAQAPGAAPGAVFRSIHTPVMNRFGHIAFQAEVTDSGFGTDNDGGIWTNREGDLQVLAHAGALAPEFGPGVTYEGFTLHHTAINDADQIVYHAFARGPGISATNSQGLVFDDGSTRRIVVQTGQSAPGSQSDLLFARLDFGDVALNAVGQVAFGGWITALGVPDQRKYGIWIEQSQGNLQPIARGGDPAPGGGLLRIDRQQPFVLNDQGQIAFAASLFENEGTGIWATDRLGVLQLIVRTGSQIEVSAGDIRTVSVVNFLHRDFDDGSSGLQDGLRAGMNNRGHIAFLAFFDDGSEGVFVSTAVAVPEPPAIGFLVVVIASLALLDQKKGV